MYQIPSNSGATESKRQTKPPPSPEHPQPQPSPALKAPVKELGRMWGVSVYDQEKKVGDSLDKTGK